MANVPAAGYPAQRFPPFFKQFGAKQRLDLSIQFVCAEISRPIWRQDLERVERWRAISATDSMESVERGAKCKLVRTRPAFGEQFLNAGVRQLRKLLPEVVLVGKKPQS